MSMAYTSGRGGLDNQASTAVSRPTIQTALNDLDPVLNQVEELVVQASKLADLVRGPAPRNGEDPKNTTASPMPPGLINALVIKRSRLVRAVARLQEELNSIENGLL